MKRLIVTNKEYSESKIVSSSFNGNYVEYEVNGYKNKNVSLSDYLLKKYPYLVDFINSKRNRQST